MENFSLMVNIQAELFVYMLVGVVMYKSKIVPERGRIYFVNFLLKIALPCMVFDSFKNKISEEQFSTAIALLIFSFIVGLFSAILGSIVWRSAPESQKGVLKYGTLISNAGFAGMPVANKAYGPLGLFYASIYVISNRVYMWTLGISFFQTTTNKKEKMKNILLNPGIIAVFLGAFRMALGINLPYFLDSSIAGIGSTTTSMSMIIVGLALGQVPIKSVWDNKALLLSAIRLVAIPLVVLVTLKYFKFEREAIGAAVILSGMPIGSTTSLLAEKYGGDYEFGSKCAFISTVFSMFTIPVMALLIDIL